ncbi:class I tRNA ligase family protein [bacterium]|nr:class I tRNA ligase family protein [bacterium]
MAHLAFWTGRDPVRMDQIFRRSGLMRDKWDEQRGAETYGQRTIATAIARCRDVYRGPVRQEAPSRDAGTSTAPPVPAAGPTGTRTLPHTVTLEDLGDGKTKLTLRHLLEFEPVMPGGAMADTDALLQQVTYPTDRWLLARLQRLEERATKANEVYEFGDAKQAAEDFFWAEFCDNYLELCKGRLYGEELACKWHADSDPEMLRLSAQATLFIALSAVLRLFAPVLPHVTEECWSWYFAKFSNGRSIHEEPWPAYDRVLAGEDEVKAGEMLVQLIALVRKWKSERNVSIKKTVQRLTIYASDKSPPQFSPELIETVKGDLMSTANALELELRPGPPPDGAAQIEGMNFAVDCELAEEEKAS